MNQGKLVFAQLMQHRPLTTCRRCVVRYRGERTVQSFSCLEQFLSMAFAQLIFREGLRDIDAWLRAQRSKLYHLGSRSTVARKTLAHANAVRDWRIYADVAQSLIAIARPLYVDEPFGVDMQDTVSALGTTTIDVCLSVCPWAPFRSTTAAVTLHTLLDLRGNIPTCIPINDGTMHEVNILDQLVPEPGAFSIMDRGFLDCARLTRVHQAGSFFVTRATSNTKAQRRYSPRIDRRTGLICDQTIFLTGVSSPQDYQAPLRRIRFKDPETAKTLIFLTNNFTVPAFTITELYRCRWQVELFFTWIEQHLRMNAFFGTSENAVTSQIWIAVSVYVLVAIVTQRLTRPASLYHILHILSLTMFERMPLDQRLAHTVTDDIDADSGKQLILFE